MTRIDIFSGFLGAGKTTLIKKLIKEAYAGEKLVLIENEFGEIGIDGGFLRDAGIEITEMNSGCICCSLVGDFTAALAEVLERFHPDRILIEPSGVGKLSDVIRAVEGVIGEDVVLGGFTTVADVNKCKMYMKNFGEFFNDQIEHADTVILSRTGVASAEKIAACVALLREHNPHATIVTTPWDELDGARILAAIEKKNTLAAEMEHLLHEHEHHHDHDHGHDHDHDHEHHHHEHDEHCDCHEHHHDHEHHHHEHGEHCTCGCHDHDHGHHHHADDVFTSIGFETVRKYTKDEIREMLDAFVKDGCYGTVLRAKGIVAGENGSFIHFDYVPGESDVRDGAADVTGRLCVIGADLDKDAIAHLFRID